MTSLTNRNFAILTPFLGSKKLPVRHVQAEKIRKTNVPYGRLRLKGVRLPRSMQIEWWTVPESNRPHYSCARSNVSSLNTDRPKKR